MMMMMMMIALTHGRIRLKNTTRMAMRVLKMAMKMVLKKVVKMEQTVVMK